jgi:hypothetical protein
MESRKTEQSEADIVAADGNISRHFYVGAIFTEIVTL